MTAMCPLRLLKAKRRRRRRKRRKRRKRRIIRRRLYSMTISYPNLQYVEN